jgi:hypothetical protein
LVEKKKYFLENQAKTTQENIQKAKEMEEKYLKELKEKAKEAEEVDANGDETGAAEDAEEGVKVEAEKESDEKEQ